MEKYRPKFIAFTSKKAASFGLGFHGKTKFVDYGLQKKTIGNSNVFVLPSTSGNGRRYWNEDYWFELKQLLNNN